jgi:hypothetical protein
MDENSLIAAIDDEIRRLQHVRELLFGVKATTAVTGKVVSTKRVGRRRRLSPATRKRIAEAQMKRWTAAKAAKSMNAPAKEATTAKKLPAKAVTTAVRKPAAKKAVAKNTKEAPVVWVKKAPA